MRKSRVYQIFLDLAPLNESLGLTAEEVAGTAGLLRHNASAILNELVREGKLRKSGGRPVRFWLDKAEADRSEPVNPIGSDTEKPGPEPEIEKVVGAQGSLRTAIEQAKAAMLYPPRGLPTLILGPTGSGKSFLAEKMYRYAIQANLLAANAPFIVFNWPITPPIRSCCSPSCSVT